jgi:hypothetical protein
MEEYNKDYNIINFEEFLKQFKKYEKEMHIKVLRDKFLDAYSFWLKNTSKANKLTVLHSALKLASVDKSFKITELFKRKTTN